MAKTTEKRNFDKEAAAWDDNPMRVKLANDVADAIIAEAKPAGTMDALDFGCGTGLVTLALQPLVKAITGADSSQGMLDVLNAKVEQRGLTNVSTQLVNFEHGERISGAFDLVVSSMTMHHVPDTATLLKQLAGHLRSGGTLCIADLDNEDGSFHHDNTGVFHYGFDRVALKGLFEAAGFSDVRDTTAARIVRPGEKGSRGFSVFLTIGRKR
jgi:2-polyprenyl-3-methyl-5-hydroxy-6-metoxy-1,4-benzoquinol methylase